MKLVIEKEKKKFELINLSLTKQPTIFDILFNWDSVYVYEITLINIKTEKINLLVIRSKKIIDTLKELKTFINDKSDSKLWLDC